MTLLLLFRIIASYVGSIEVEEGCAPRTGLILLNLLGRLGNNHFQIAFARRLAKELCWDVISRQHWQASFLTNDTDYCFPNALLPQEAISDELKDYLEMDEGVLTALDERTRSPSNNKNIGDWVKQLERQGKAWKCEAGSCNHNGASVNRVLARIKNRRSKIRLVHLQAFFINSELMLEGGDNQHWLEINPSCCHHEPPENAVVIHVRHFWERGADGFNQKFTIGVYKDLLKHYNLTTNPVWVVCEPKAVDIQLVQDMRRELKAVIHTGDDPIDAHCILRKAKTLVTSVSSTFSQSAAYFSVTASDMQVHCPVHRLRRPEITLLVPHWKYHLVHKSKKRIKMFDVDHERMREEVA